MSNETTPPIPVTDEIIPTAVASLARTLFTIAATAAVSAGYVDADNVEGIGIILAALATAGYGIYKQIVRKQQLRAGARDPRNEALVLQ